MGRLCRTKIGDRYGKLVVISRDPIDYIRTDSGRPRPRWRCVCDCGGKATVMGGNLRAKGVRSCGCLSKELRGEKHPNWHGGRIVDGEGYIRIKNKAHPRANKRGYVLEHIAVIIAKLGRPLFPEESVHHKNGIKMDNRPDNLEIPLHHPPGQRVEDMLVWAKSIIKRYSEPGASAMPGGEPDGE